MADSTSAKRAWTAMPPPGCSQRCSAANRARSCSSAPAAAPTPRWARCWLTAWRWAPSCAVLPATRPCCAPAPRARCSGSTCAGRSACAWQSRGSPTPRTRLAMVPAARATTRGAQGPRPPRLRRVDAGPDGRHRPARRRRPAVPPAAVRPARRAEHARPAQLPQRAGRVTPPRRAGAGPRRSATRTAPSPVERQLEWLKGSLRRTAAQWKVIGNPVMIAPVNFADAPRRPDRPGQRRHRAAARGRLPVQRRPVGRLHRRPQAGLQAHPRPPGQGRPLHHRRHPLRLGRRAAVRRRDVHRSGASRPRRRVRVHLGDLEQPQGHHRYAAAHDERRRRGGDHRQQPAHQVPQLRRPRLLGPRPDAEAGADGLVHHRRPGRPRRRRSPGRRRTRPAPAPARVVAVDQPVGA